MATPPPHLHPTESSLTIQPRVSPAAAFPRRHHRLRWSLLSLSGIVIILLGLAGWIGYRAIAVVNTKKDGGQRVSFFQQLTHLVTASNQQLQGENDDRVNILLLGIGGPGHDGPYLTDTMIVASYKPSTRQLSLLSIPRDLVVNIPGYDYRKINNVLSFGRDIKYPGGGETLTTKVVSDLLGIPIQYYARVDFKGFAEVIDQVGGVNVTVDQAFTDSQYPTENYGYQTVWFKAGPQQMNGDLALKYSRSRHGNNGEGSDFARARRQQKVIFGLKERLLSFGTLVNPKKISDILGSLGSHSQTNMEVWEMARLAQLVSSIKSTDIINKVIDSSPNGLLQDETGLGGAFILVPKNRSYDDIAFLARHIFLISQAEQEQPHVLVVNATALPHLAESTAQGLLGFGLTTVKAATLNDATIGRTVLIDTSAGHADQTLQLAGLYRHVQGTISLEQWTSETGDTSLAKLLAEGFSPTNTNAAWLNNNRDQTVTPLANERFDIVLILGQDQPRNANVATIPIFAAPPKKAAAINTNKTPVALGNTNSLIKNLVP